MRLKPILVTVAVLAVLSIGVFIMRQPAAPASADARINEPLVSTATVEKVAKLRLTDAGKTVEVVAQPDATWRVPSYYDLPAEFSKLSTFVNSLTNAQVQRLVTSNPERIARLEFGDARIELRDAADQVLFSVTLGKMADTGGGGRFVRFGDENKAYLTNLNAWLDTESRNWVSAELVKLRPADVAKIVVPLADGNQVTLTRASAEESWTAENGPASRTLKADQVPSLLSILTSIRFSETSALDDPNFAAARQHARTFTLTTFDGKTVTVSLGRKPEEKKLKPVVAKADGTSGPAALGSITDLTKQADSPEGAKSPAELPLAPEFETIPAGPVFVEVTNSDAAAPINAMMQKRAFQVPEYTFTSLPQNLDSLFNPAAE